MLVPIPVLIAIGLGVLVLLVLALRRRGGDRDLIAPPPMGAATPPPRAWPAAGAPVGVLPPELEAEVRALLARDRKIDAIKLVRQVTHLGLGEAKELVERL